MAIGNFAEYFGCDSAEILEEKDRAEGYIAGTKEAISAHKIIINNICKGKSRAFREAYMDALREQL